MVVTFSVPFVIPKARPRFSGHAYTPKRTADAEKRVLEAYRGACVRLCGRVVGAPADAKVTIAVTMRKAAPKNRPKLVPKALWDAGAYPFTQVPDYDNVAKLVCDALNGTAWEDDSQICEAHVYKLDRRRGTTDMTCVTVIWEEKDG